MWGGSFIIGSCKDVCALQTRAGATVKVPSL